MGIRPFAGRWRLWLAAYKAKRRWATDDFFTLVDRHFRFLTERGMLVTRTDYSFNSFGNAFVNYQGIDCSVRVIRDRSQIFVNIGTPRTDAGGPSASEWIDIGLAMSYVEAKQSGTPSAELRPVVDFSAREAVQVEQAASFLLESLDTVSSAIRQEGWSHFDAEVSKYFREYHYPPFLREA